VRIKGRVHRFGDDVNTDEIIPARFLSLQNPDELASHCFEDTRPGLKVRGGDIIVAGKNFGCGSSREHAPIAIKKRGFSCVIAPSFARIFYRNAINIGLPIFESVEVKGIQEGDELEVDTQIGKIRNLTRREEYTIHPFPPFIEELIRKGGLMEYGLSKMRGQDV
jgi:3-isopropylmalate dehydratase small subunit